MKIYLEVEALPEYVILMRERFRVSSFVDPPFQCFNCQSFGHSAKNCKKDASCVICAGNHIHTICPNKDSFRKCSNCNGNHTSSYGGCVRMKAEKQIQRFKVNNNLSYRDATLQFNANNSIQSNTNNSESVINNNSHYRNPQSSKVLPHARTAHRVDVGIQTEMISVDTQTESSEVGDKSTTPKELKLASCLLEILYSMNKADSLSKKCAMISKAFNTYLGTNINQSSLLKEVKTGMQQPSPSPVISVPSRNPEKK